MTVCPCNGQFCVNCGRRWTTCDCQGNLKVDYREIVIEIVGKAQVNIGPNNFLVMAELVGIREEALANLSFLNMVEDATIMVENIVTRISQHLRPRPGPLERGLTRRVQRQPLYARRANIQLPPGVMKTANGSIPQHIPGWELMVQRIQLLRRGVLQNEQRNQNLHLNSARAEAVCSDPSRWDSANPDRAAERTNARPTTRQLRPNRPPDFTHRVPALPQLPSTFGAPVQAPYPNGEVSAPPRLHNPPGLLVPWCPPLQAGTDAHPCPHYLLERGMHGYCCIVCGDHVQHRI